MVTREEKPYIYRLKISIPSEDALLPYARPVTLSIYPDYLLLGQTPPRRINFQDIRQIEFKDGAIHLDYHDRDLEFIVSSTLEGVSDAATTELVLELLRALLDKEYTSFILEALKKTDQKKRRENMFLLLLSLISVGSFIAGMGGILSGHPTRGMVGLWAALIALMLIIPAAFLRSRRDLFFRHRLIKSSLHYHLADNYLKNIEGQSAHTDEETRTYYLSKAMQQLEKIIALDPHSECIALLRTRMFPEKYPKAALSENDFSFPAPNPKGE